MQHLEQKRKIDYYYNYYYSFFCSWFTTTQSPGLYPKPEATGRDIFLGAFVGVVVIASFLLLKFLGFYFTLIFFIVAYIDNAFLNMCAVLVSTILVSLLGFVYQEFFQDVLQFHFSLILMHQ